MTTSREMEIMVGSLENEYEWKPRPSGLTLEEDSEDTREFIQDRHRCLVDLEPTSQRQGLFIEGASSFKSYYRHAVLAHSLSMKRPAGGQCGREPREWKIGYISGETQLPDKLTREQFDRAAQQGVYMLVHRST